ncbi:transcriptional regulator with XRE-family HTH domain [Leucobacter exalbidus]|uniref:Transcriptional regulator with XRE-family HTH domain n=1 Tax=Leucobacter exalbidus TaxID=662960 RepID=A0A940T467_9MICO|nr:helix-turn-helix transcriptional regulator [Leucobacter exalbidus]MBP1326912.1 transcriptional regulator with XRE-family HTH domain [Leucobacter exalbidus]
MAKVSSVAAVKIGARIRAVRRKFGISLEDLGELSEISWTSIGKIERGASSPTAESLVRLATALEVDPGIFLSGIVADDYGVRAHRFTVRDLIRGRAEQRDEAVEPTAAPEGSAEASPETHDSGDDGDAPEAPGANAAG